MSIDADWDKPQWRRADTAGIALFMGARPSHIPKTRVRLLYDSDNIYVCFRVEDRFVRAIAAEYNGKVWEDGCVEFFLTPSADISSGYFNVETNCIGTILMHSQPVPDRDITPLPVELISQIEIATSLPKGRIIDPEQAGAVTWTLEYRLPLAILKRYRLVMQPGQGVKWRANFYKCAETNSHPHWLTWSKVENSTPNFHLPQFFGTLEFVD